MDFRIQSFKRAAFWSTAIHAFGQLLALGFSMVMASVFGAQESTDVLYYCVGVFALLSGLIQAVNANVLIPETMRRRHREGEEDAMAFINRFFAVFGVLMLVVTGWMLLDPARALASISRFPLDALRRNTGLLFWLLATLPLQMAAQLLLDVLVSYKFLTLPAALSCVSRAINIVFVLLFHRRLGVASMALGLLLGLSFQVMLNAYLLRRVIRWNPFAWKTRIGGTVYRNILWVEAGTAVSALAGYLPLYLFSGFGAGVLTALNFARRLSDAPVGLLTAQITGVTAVKFNELAARRQEDELSAAYVRISRLIVFVLVPLSVMLLLTGPDMVRILFGRGAFRDGEALGLTSVLFGLFVIGMPMIGTMMVIARYFVAQQAVGYGTRWQIASNVFFAGVVYVFIRAMGPVGFPAGVIVHMALYLAVLSVSMARRFPQLPTWPVWKALLATSAACYTVAAPIWLARQRWGAGFSPWATGAATAMLFMAAYGALLAFWPPDRMAWGFAKEQAALVVRKIRAWLSGGVGYARG